MESNIEYRYNGGMKMARRKFQTLTEPMFYILMSLQSDDRCGIDISAYIAQKSAGRVAIGPGTLYALLGDFEQEGVIHCIGVEGKRKIYRISELGRSLYAEELNRLKRCISDAEGGGESESVGEGAGAVGVMREACHATRA